MHGFYISLVSVVLNAKVKELLAIEKIGFLPWPIFKLRFKKFNSIRFKKIYCTIALIYFTSVPLN